MKEFRRSFLVRDRLKESVFERCVEVAFEGIIHCLGVWASFYLNIDPIKQVNSITNPTNITVVTHTETTVNENTTTNTGARYIGMSLNVGNNSPSSLI